MTIDQEYVQGAKNAIRVCLNIQPNERVTVMQLEQVDVIATESLQACLDRAHDV